MRTIKIPTLLFAVMALAAACAKEGEAPSSPSSGELVPVTFTATGELTKTSYSAGKVYWETTDKVSLFSGDDYATKTELSVSGRLYEDGAKAEFEGLAADGSQSYIAVYPSAEVNEYSGSSLMVGIPSEQVAVAGGFMSGANTAVATSTDNSLVFSNVGALVGIRFGVADAISTTAVRLKAKKSETEFAGLSGAASVTFDEQTGAPVSGEGAADYVTLMAPDGGFVSGAVYFMVVYPGDYHGFELTLTQNGQDVMKTSDIACKLERSSYVTIGQKLSPVSDLPDDFTITIDFTAGWPFNEVCAASDQQTTSGEKYTYYYKHPDGLSTTELEFGILKGTSGTNSYSMVDGGLQFTNTSDNPISMIGCPGIEGRYLKEVRAVHGTYTDGKARTRRFNLTEGFPATGGNLSHSWVSAGIEDVFVVKDALGESKIGQVYSVRMRDDNMLLTKLTLVYSSTNPNN